MLREREKILSTQAAQLACDIPESSSLTSNARPHHAPYVRLTEPTTFEAGGWKLYLSPALTEKTSDTNGNAPRGAQVYLTLAAGTTLVVTSSGQNHPPSFQLKSGAQQLGANMTQATIVIQWTGGSVSSFHLDPSYLDVSSPVSARLRLEGFFTVYFPPDCLLTEKRY